MISRPSNSGQTLTFGTRGSALALVQTELAIKRFRSVFPEWSVEARAIKTEGDLDKRSPLTEIGGRGVFTNALETAVLAGEVDAAVHSAKDLPTALHPDTPIVAFPERADPRDVLVSRHGVALDRLPSNPIVGTSSRRRAVQIARLRPDARIVDLRGNIDTRLRKAAGDGFDAIVLAAAGLQRMGWHGRATQFFAVHELTPSPAQGALAIQARRGSDTPAMLGRIDDPAVSRPVGVERAFLAAIGAGCSLPVGAYVAETCDGLRLTAMLADEAGARIEYVDEVLSSGDECAHAADVAARLRAEVDREWRRGGWPGAPGADAELDGARVVVTRPRRQAGELAAALSARGAHAILLPTIRIEAAADTSALDEGLQEAGRGAFDWLVFTSANAVEVCARRMSELGLRNGWLGSIDVAVIGGATAAAAAAAGFSVRLVSEIPTAEGLGEALTRIATMGQRVLFPRSAIGRDTLPRELQRAGIEVVSVDAYATASETDVDGDALELVRRGELDLLTFSSPSSVRGLIELLEKDAAAVLHVPAVCSGPATAEAAKDAGFAVVVSGRDAGAEAMAEAGARVWRTRTGVGETPGASRLTGVSAGVGAIGRSGG